MPALENHPSVVAVRNRERAPATPILSADDLRQLCIDAGADDVGFITIDRPEIATASSTSSHQQKRSSGSSAG